MIKIYCIEDINDLKYVGSTKQELYKRLSHHRSNKQCSSNKLNLYYCIIYTLEECEEKDKKEREQYYIDTIDCVNKNKVRYELKDLYQKDYNEYQKEYMREYREKNKDKNKEACKKYRKKNRDKINERRRLNYHKNKSKNKI